MKIIYLIFKIVVFLALLLLTFKNIHNVGFHFGLSDTYQIPLIILLGIFLVIGAILGILSMLGRVLRLRSEVASLQKNLKKANETVEGLLQKETTLSTSIPIEQE